MNALSIASTSIRQFDGLYSLNDLHQSSGGNKNHRPNQWLRLEQTQALIAEVNRCADMRNAIITKRGGDFQGTFASKELVVAYATWISAEFFLKVIQVFLKTAEQANPQIQLATPAQKQHLKSLVSDRVSKTGLHFQKVWTAVQEANGFNRLDNLTPQSYAKACAYFKTDPIGLNPDDWAHAPVALPQSQPATFKVPDGMMLIPRTAALNLWSMAKQLTSGIDALGMVENDMPKWLVA